MNPKVVNALSAMAILAAPPLFASALSGPGMQQHYARFAENGEGALHRLWPQAPRFYN